MSATNIRNIINLLESIQLEAKDKSDDIFSLDDVKPPKAEKPSKKVEKPNKGSDSEKVSGAEKKLDDILIKPAGKDKILKNINFRLLYKHLKIPAHMHRDLKNAVHRLADRSTKLSKNESKALLYVLEKLQSKIG
jgi:hypothetical protein